MQLSILGAGQLGGSFALALREAQAPITIVAYDTNPAHVRYLQEQGSITRAADSVGNAVKDADIVLLAVPLRSYPALAREMAPHLKANAIVTDLGSVKRSMAALAGMLPAACLVPAHPIAGSENSGPEAARSDLFAERLLVLTPGDETSAEAIQVVEQLWQLVGADVIRMPVEIHDQIYAHVSHLPHLIAFASAQFLHHMEVHIAPAETKLRQFLRIARSNARMWTDIALENREAILPALATYLALLEHFVRELKSGDAGVTAERGTIVKTLLPRIIAGSLISNVSLYEQQSGLNLRAFAAGGLRDIVAPAADAPDADVEAISNHAGTIAALLTQWIATLRELENLIGGEDESGLFAAISGMRADADTLLTR